MITHIWFKICSYMVVKICVHIYGHPYMTLTYVCTYMNIISEIEVVIIRILKV